ncbi:MAG: hypothetical protein HQ564_06275 [Candidatus Saganbacteria bacterium]|nr:hypothetical protein [Candidatus Saganbacteria bacterium]
MFNRKMISFNLENTIDNSNLKIGELLDRASEGQTITPPELRAAGIPLAQVLIDRLIGNGKAEELLQLYFEPTYSPPENAYAKEGLSYTINNDTADGNVLDATSINSGQNSWSFRTEYKIAGNPYITNGNLFLFDEKNYYMLDPQTGREKCKYPHYGLVQRIKLVDNNSKIQLDLKNGGYVIFDEEGEIVFENDITPRRLPQNILERSMRDLGTFSSLARFGFDTESFDTIEIPASAGGRGRNVRVVLNTVPPGRIGSGEPINREELVREQERTERSIASAFRALSGDSEEE